MAITLVKQKVLPNRKGKQYNSRAETPSAKVDK
jgi:hypothetical protein